MKTGFISALYTGMWSYDFDVNPVCPSSNCTCPEFPSMGFCGHCEDMTSSATLVGCDNLSFNTSNLDKQSVSCNVTFGDGTWVNDVVTISWQQKGDGGALVMPEPGE